MNLHEHGRSCHHRKYYLTCETFDLLLAQSGQSCQLCGKGGRSLVIDHDHALGASKVRGLLCSGCNVRMGHVDRSDRDDLDLGALDLGAFADEMDEWAQASAGIAPGVADVEQLLIDALTARLGPSVPGCALVRHGRAGPRPPGLHGDQTSKPTEGSRR